jgi:hypothetical protein
MKMRNSIRILTLFAAFAGTLVAARADVCDDLSYQRNLIYKAAGYCFRTAAQISIFGNAGCRYDNQVNVPLSQRQRQMVGDLVRQEQGYGCRR